MADISPDKVLDGVDFPHNKWRKLDAQGNLVCKQKAIGVVKRLQSLKLETPEIRQILADLYWDAFVEHELQVKEVVGQTVRENIESKLCPKS